MKKYILLFSIIVAHFVTQAQGLEITNPQTTISGTNSDLLYIKLHVKNNLSEDQIIITKRYIISVATGQRSYFCFSTSCYSPFVDISPDAVTITPGGEDSTFKGYLDPKNNDGVSVVKYCFQNNVTTDSTCITLTYEIGQSLGIIHNSEKAFLKAFPNPANEVINLAFNTQKDFSEKRIIIHDLTGRKVMDNVLNESEGIFTISTNELNNGVYICSLIVDGKSITNEKLVISK